MFDIFNALPTNGEWFYPPYDDMQRIEICRKSGYRATDLCEKDTIWASKNGSRSKACFYHQTLHFDVKGQFQVTSDCENPQNMLHKSWFALPPLEEYYYRPKHPDYLIPPQYRADCRTTESKINPMQLIYPKSITKIFIPIDFDGKLGSVVFRVAHRVAQTTVFWHLDDAFVGKTAGFHQLSMTPSVGKHRLTLVDENGNRLVQNFEILAK